MKFFRHRAAAVSLAACLSFIVSGCDQPTAKQQEITPTAVAAPTSDKADATKGNDAELESLVTLNVEELTALALKKLGDNDVDTAKMALAEARKKSIDFPGAKFDIARLLFGAGEMKASVEVYDEILELRPDIKPELWQRGLALYYAEEYEKGVDQFNTHQGYNSQDVENSVWQLLCKSRLSSVEEARKTMIQIDHDTRVPMKQVFDMFAGTGSPEDVIAATGFNPEKVIRNSSTYHGWLYVGLFQEMMGDQEASNNAMNTALKCKPFIPSLMGYVAEGHLRARGAYPADDK